MGWGFDQPSSAFPGGDRRLPTRLTAVPREEDGDPKVVHLHFSVGVPDEQVIELAAAAPA